MCGTVVLASTPFSRNLHECDEAEFTQAFARAAQDAADVYGTDLLKLQAMTRTLYVFLDAETPEELKPDRWETGVGPPLSPHAQAVKDVQEAEDRHAFAEIDRFVSEAEG